MLKKCINCGLQVDTNEYKRCPRCNYILEIPKKCEECKGCSIFNLNKCKM